MMSYFRSPNASAAGNGSGKAEKGKRRGGGSVGMGERVGSQSSLFNGDSAMDGDDVDSDDDTRTVNTVRSGASGASSPQGHGEEDDELGGQQEGEGGEGHSSIDRGRGRSDEWAREDMLDATLLLPSASSVGEGVAVVEEDVIYEHQRYNPVKGWSAKHLLPLDPAHFTRQLPPLGQTKTFTTKSSATFKALSSLPLAPGDSDGKGTAWAWLQPSWRLQTAPQQTDPEGWVYALSAGSFILKRGQASSAKPSTYCKPGSVTLFRRRVWSRKRVRYLMASGSPLGVGSPLGIGRRLSNLGDVEGGSKGSIYKGVGSPGGVSAAGAEDRATELLQLPDTPGAFRLGSAQDSGSQQSLSALALNLAPFEKLPQRRRAASFSSLDPRLLRHPTMSVPNNVNTRGRGLGPHAHNSPFSSSPSLYSPPPPSTTMQAFPSSPSLGSTDQPQPPSTPVTTDAAPGSSPVPNSPVSSSAPVSPPLPAPPVSPDAHVLSRHKSSLGMSSASICSMATDGGPMPVSVTADKDRPPTSDAVRAKLAAIGHHLRMVHEEDKEDMERHLKDWTDNGRPERLKRIKAFKERDRELQKRRKDAAAEGWQAVQAVEDELRELQSQMDEEERRVLFPGALLTFGTCGSYAGLTDLWIEGIRCQFVLDLVPADVSEAGVILRPAQIHLLLCGVGDGKGGGAGASGFSVRMLAEGFNLKGDKAPNLPLDLSTMKVTAILQVLVSMEFDDKAGRWRMDRPDDLGITIMQFRGPLFSRKQLLDMLLNMVRGAIRRQLAETMAPELGHYLSQRRASEEAGQRPITVRGELTLEGTKLKALKKKLYESHEGLELLGWSAAQAKAFIRLQKDVFRDSGLPVIKSISDGIEYARMRLRNPKRWRRVVRLWERAAWELEKMGSTSVDVAGFFRVVTGVGRKPMALHLRILHLDLTLLLHGALDALQALCRRLATATEGEGSSKQPVKGARRKAEQLGGLQFKRPLEETLAELDRIFDEVNSVLREVESRVESVGSRLSLRLQGGEEAKLSLGLRQFHALVPVGSALTLPLPQRMVNAMQGPGLPIYILTEPLPSAEGGVGLQLRVGEQVGSGMGAQMLRAVIGKATAVLSLQPPANVFATTAPGSPLQQTGSPSSKGDWRTALTVDLGPSDRSPKGAKTKHAPISPMSSITPSSATAQATLSSNQLYADLATQADAGVGGKEGEGEGKPEQSLRASFSAAQATGQVPLTVNTSSTSLGPELEVPHGPPQPPSSPTGASVSPVRLSMALQEPISFDSPAVTPVAQQEQEQPPNKDDADKPPSVEVKVQTQFPLRLSVTLEHADVEAQPIHVFNFIQRRLPMTESKWKLTNPEMDCSGMDMFKVKRIASLGRRYLVGARSLDVEFNIRFESLVTCGTGVGKDGKEPQPEVSVSVRPYESEHGRNGGGGKGPPAVTARVFTTFRLFDILDKLSMTGDNFAYNAS